MPGLPRLETPVRVQTSSLADGQYSPRVIPPLALSPPTSLSPLSPLADKRQPKQSLLQQRKQRLGNLRLETSCNVSLNQHDGLKARYIVHESLGQGSMGTVYRGTRRSDQREVALKAMQALDEEMTELLKQEFKILRKLSHPHVIEALDFFVADDQAVLVLELFEGLPLSAAARSTPCALPECVGQRLFKQLTLAVDYLHHRQIIHRDIKGENVLVGQNLMDLRLIDFNSARCLLEGGSLTNAGTQEYASPEVCRGEPHSASSDIWCAGLCLYLMLAGHLPRRGHQYKSFEAFKEAVSTEAVVLKGRIESCSEVCKEVIRLCLYLDMTKRPSAEALLQHEWLLPRGGKRHTVQSRLPVVFRGEALNEDRPASPVSRTRRRMTK